MTLHDKVEAKLNRQTRPCPLCDDMMPWSGADPGPTDWCHSCRDAAITLVAATDLDEIGPLGAKLREAIAACPAAKALIKMRP